MIFWDYNWWFINKLLININKRKKNLNKYFCLFCLLLIFGISGGVKLIRIFFEYDIVIFLIVLFVMIV